MAHVTTGTIPVAPRMSKDRRTPAPKLTSPRSVLARLPQRALGAVAALPAQAITAQLGVLARGKLDGGPLPLAAAQAPQAPQVAQAPQVRQPPAQQVRSILNG